MHETLFGEPPGICAAVRLEHGIGSGMFPTPRSGRS
jgi:hypothetical protein